MSKQKRASVSTALETPTHASEVANGFGGGERRTSRPVRKSVRPQTDSSKRLVMVEPTAKITFKMPQAKLDQFEELYELLRAEEKAKKRRFTKVAFAGLVFEHGLKEEPIRKAIRAVG